MQLFNVFKVSKLVILSLFLISNLAIASEDCHGTPLRNNDPTAFLMWLGNNGNRNRTIEDVVCCMPEKYRESYIVSHSSLSAQTANYFNPRVIFGSLANDGIMFSISGGDPRFNQAESIEVMIDNKITDKLELFDIEFQNGQKHRSRPNPELCMSCHGSRGVVGVGGPRPIFDRDPWPRMASSETIAPPNCTGFTSFAARAQIASFTSIVDNPRFRCLKTPVSRNETKMGTDITLERFNDRRVFKEMLALPNFSEVKHLLIGAELGCFGYHTNSGEIEVLQNPKDWLRSSFFNDNLDESFLSQRVVEAQQKGRQALFLYIKDKVNEYFDKLEVQDRTFFELSSFLLNAEYQPMPAHMGFHQCLSNSAVDERLESLQLLQQSVEMFPALVRMYVFDTLVRNIDNGRQFSLAGVKNLMRMSVARWAFESQGYDMSGTGMMVIPNYERDFLKNIKKLPDFDTYNQKVRTDGLPEVCEQLKNRSLEASPDQ